MPTLPSKILPWLAPVDLASHRHGVDRVLLFAILDRETACATSKYLDQPGPGGCGDRSPRPWSRYAKRPALEKYVKRWRPSADSFRLMFPKVPLKADERVPEICLPFDGRGWGRGGFQIDFFGDFTAFGGESNLEFCLRRLKDGRYAWEDPGENAKRAALILHTAIDAFDHDEWLAASAYNAGIAAVQKALLSVREPALEMRHAAADSCTTGKDYARDVMRRRKDFRRLLAATPKEFPNV